MKEQKLDYRNIVLNQIYQNHHPFLHAYAMKICRNERAPDVVADDLLQEMYCKLITKWTMIQHSYLYQKSERYYLFSMIRNAYRDSFKSQTKLNLLHQFYMYDEPTTYEYHYQEAKEGMPAYVKNALSDTEYQVVVRKFVNGWKHRQIADDLCMPENTVTTHWNRAKRKLEKVLCTS